MTTCPTCSAAVQPADVHCGQCGAVLSAPTIPAGAPATGAAFFAPGTAVRPTWVPAGVLRRIAAWTVDNAIVNAALIPLAVFVGWVEFNAWTLVVALFFSPLSLVYRPVLWRFNDGQTVGQRLLRIRVCAAAGEPIGLGRGVWRVLATWLLVFAVSIPVSILNTMMRFGGGSGIPDVWAFILAPLVGLSMLWDSRRRTWFDRWSKTRVEAVTPARTGLPT